MSTTQRRRHVPTSFEIEGMPMTTVQPPNNITLRRTTDSATHNSGGGLYSDLTGISGGTVPTLGTTFQCIANNATGNVDPLWQRYFTRLLQTTDQIQYTEHHRLPTTDARRRELYMQNILDGLPYDVYISKGKRDRFFLKGVPFNRPSVRLIIQQIITSPRVDVRWRDFFRLAPHQNIQEDDDIGYFATPT